ncbi:Bug family tripartite tricarboxylate transporter substrate binding protein [Ottowia oryzae]|uniref:Tripartite tricarboxylate transporter substrate binding protein n=1 Tax=Ottowia oryzae TaxID=2109914 RepID=A0A2S0MFG4_9BURK|nr:tripartite tricarboxylate transporter substrate binding protein [Ottowia oryzae]AVO34618.1 tripartite tricarboxylate transporter substrate binding protein [Ottowia oryzae]
MTVTRRAAAAAFLIACLPAAAFASGNWPEKPIKLIVPFPPGGGGDNMARLVMNRVAQELGQPLVVENLSGAGGNVGSIAAVKAPADGYTLLYGTNGTFGINQTLYRKPGFSATNDFVPVGRLTTIAAMVVVRPGLGVKTMGELTKLLKANPGKYTFASAGNGTTSHMAGEMLKTALGAFVVHVPYRGGAPAITDVIGGQVDYMIDVMPNTAPQVRGGKLLGLAVSTAKRVPGFDNVPTIAESGVAGFDVGAWDAIFAPKGTPAEVVDKVNAAIRKVLADPEMQNQLASRGAVASPSTPAELRSFVATEVDRWGKAVKQSGATID